MLNKLKKLGVYLTAAFTLSAPLSSRGDGLDGLIQNVSIDERSGEWRDHLLSSFFQTELDAILFEAAKAKNPEDVAAKTKFVETLVHQGFYTPAIEDKLTPIYAASDLLGTEFANRTYGTVGENFKPVVKKLTRVPDLDEIITLGTIVGIGYLLRQERTPLDIDLHSKENIDWTTLSHVAYLWYTTTRLSLQVNSINKSYKLEKIAWRNFKLGLAKELIYDAGWGTGPSLFDAGADTVGTFLGYKTAKYLTKKDLLENFNIIPNNQGLKISYNF